jgi:hypothetical protein
VLVFCGTINRVEKTAQDLATMCEKGLFQVHERVMSSGNSPSKRLMFLERLPKNTSAELRACLQQGIGYHHSSAIALFLQLHVTLSTSSMRSCQGYPCIVLKSALRVLSRQTLLLCRNAPRAQRGMREGLSGGRHLGACGHEHCGNRSQLAGAASDHPGSLHSTPQ